MRLRKLTVTDFRNIGHAQIEFGLGLNVLYGPNELGKSGLAEAIRAAFLARPSSSYAREFIPCGTDANPHVVVEFEMTQTDEEEDGSTEAQGSAVNEDDETREDEFAEGNATTSAKRTVVWRVEKEFSRNGKASLYRLKPSGGLVEEAKGRDVEGKLQAILEWVINPPGGRSGGAYKMASSYLTTALLGRQDNVTEILSAELDNDKHESGREALTQALGALAQDALVGRVLERLEKELRPVFSPSGQQRRRQDSPIVQMTEKVKAQGQVVLDLERIRNESEDTRERFETARVRQLELTDLCASLEESSRHWHAMEQTLGDIKSGCERNSIVERLRKELAELQQRLNGAQRRQADARDTLEKCDKSLSKAKNQRTAAQTTLEQLGKSRDESEAATRKKLDASKSRCELDLQRANELLRVITARSGLERQRDELSRKLETERATKDRAKQVFELSRLIEQRRQAQANAKEFDKAHELSRQSELDHRQHLDELKRIKQELRSAESELEKERRLQGHAKEALAEADQSSGSRAFHRSSLENNLRKAQDDYRLVKQRAERQTLLDDRRQLVEGLRDKKSRLDLNIESAEAATLAAWSAVRRWRVAVGAAAVVL